MVKVYDPNANERAMKNATVLIILYGSITLFFFYLAFSLMVITINGLPSLIKIFQLEFKLHVQTILRTISAYFYWWLNHRKQLGLQGGNFFVIKFFGSFVVSFGTMGILGFIFRKKIMTYIPFEKEASNFGDAHWATKKEIIKIGLRAKKGVLMGVDNDGYLIAEGFQHTLLFAPTGSGKGVGFVVPNLLFWEQSVICHDIKLENYELTSGWRNKHLKQDVYVWEPSNSKGMTHAYNPVEWVSTDPGQMVDDVQKFANLILQKKEFWENEARTLLVGVLLYLIAEPEIVPSFGEVVRTLRGDDFAYDMAVALDTKGDIIHPVGYMNLAAFLQKADKERSGVVSTLNSGLELWANPLIDAATARSDFDMRTFKIKPTTVYVGLTPDNIQRLRSLISMFYQQATDFFSNHMPTKEEKFGILMLMDEFPTLGKMEQILAGVAYLRGYKVRLFLIVQDTQQLKGAYEESGMNSFLSNSTYRITFAANNIETARLISDLIGNQTVESESFSRKKFLDLNPSSASTNVSSTQRALLLPQEVIALPRTDQIILIEAASPIRTKKILYYKDKMFTKRLWDKTNRPQQTPVQIKRKLKPNPESENVEQTLLPPPQDEDSSNYETVS